MIKVATGLCECGHLRKYHGKGSCTLCVKRYGVERGCKGYAPMVPKTANDEERESPPAYVLSVDPGDVHVGMAVITEEGCVWAGEKTPGLFLSWLRQELLSGRIRLVVVEEFRLYSWMAEKQSWSDFPTAQLIGAIKAAVAWFGGVVDDETGEKRGDRKVDTAVIMQPASIKKPTTKILRAKGIKSVAKALSAGGHAQDAELHGLHWLMRAAEKRGLELLGD